MVPRQQVVDYISSGMRSGFDIISIRSRLIASGYDVAEVNSAIDAIKAGKSKINSAPQLGSHSFLAIAMAIFLIVAVGGVIIVKLTTNSDLPIDDPSGGIDPDITVSPPVIKDPVPKTPLKNTTTGGTKPDPIKPGGATTGGRDLPSIDYTGKTIDNALTTRLAIENRVNAIAASYPYEASQLCYKINTVAGQHSCLNTVAQASENSEYCILIEDDYSADSCLTELALAQAEDINLCRKMKSEISTRRCVLLYDSQSQIDYMQQAIKDIPSPPLTTPDDLTQEQLDAAYEIGFEDIIVTPPPVEPPEDENPPIVEEPPPEPEPQEEDPQVPPAEEIPSE